MTGCFAERGPDQRPPTSDQTIAKGENAKQRTHACSAEEIAEQRSIQRDLQSGAQPHADGEPHQAHLAVDSQPSIEHRCHGDNETDRHHASFSIFVTQPAAGNTPEHPGYGECCGEDPGGCFGPAQLGADALRYLTLQTCSAKESGHPGGFASSADAYAALVMLGHTNIITEVGHHAPGFYSAMFLDGSLQDMDIHTMDDMMARFRERHGLLGHLSGAIPGLLAPAGPLGQGQHKSSQTLMT